MPGWLKALLIVLVVIIVLVVGVVVAGVYYVSRNKDTWIAKGKAVVTEGRDFGYQSATERCVDEFISRHQIEPGVGSPISNSLFMQACLDSSRPTPNFC